jgi:hypothetical protein
VGTIIYTGLGRKKRCAQVIATDDPLALLDDVGPTVDEDADADCDVGDDDEADAADELNASLCLL